MKLLILVLILLVLGFIFYKLKPYKFTSNSIVILNLLHEELENLEKKLVFTNSAQLRQVIINRINEIKYTLKQFYGTVV